MGASKDLQIEIRATMSEDVYRDIPEHLRDEMTIKAIEVTNWKAEYKKDELWWAINDGFIKELKARKQREEEIRTEIRNK